MSNIVIGIDVGGSHITSAGVDLNTFKIVPETTFSGKINNKAGEEEILLNWGNVINKTIRSLNINSQVKLGFAMPGPFDYTEGVALFEKGQKYEKLFNTEIASKLACFVRSDDLEMRFINDALAFGVGVSIVGKAKYLEKILAITLGTGLGSAFVKNTKPLTHQNSIPHDGFLWNLPYKTSIADDYFSTRWCVKRFFQLSGIKVEGVKDIANVETEVAEQVFVELGENLAEFLSPHLRRFQLNILVLGRIFH